MTKLQKNGDLFLFVYIIGTMACFYIAADVTYHLSCSTNSTVMIGTDMKMVAQKEYETENHLSPSSDSLNIVRRKFLILWTIVGLFYASYVYGSTAQAANKSSNSLEAIGMCSLIGLVSGVMCGFILSLLFSIAVHHADNPALLEISSLPQIIFTGCLAIG